MMLRRLEPEDVELLMLSIEFALNGISSNTFEKIRSKLYEKFEFHLDDCIEYPHALKCILDEFLDADSYDDFLKLLDKSLGKTELNDQVSYFVNVLKI